MFYGSYVFNGEKHAAIYDSWDLWHRERSTRFVRISQLFPLKHMAKAMPTGANPSGKLPLNGPIVKHGRFHGAKCRPLRTGFIVWENATDY